METKAPVRAKRKRSPRPTKTGKKRPGTSAYLKKMWADPEYRAAMVEKRRAAAARRKDNPQKHYRRGVPDGMRKAEADALWARAREQGRKFIEMLEDADKVERVPVPGSEAEMAKKVLEEAYVQAVSPLGDSKTKIGWARIVLDFTKSKPESKTKLTLDKSEEWLAMVAADMKSDGNSRAE